MKYSPDLSYASAAIVLPKDYQRLRVIQIGGGGTGSFAASSIARVLYEIRLRLRKEIEFMIVDPDTVESGNIPRSNFCFAEVGRSKARCLAERISAAWGFEVTAAVAEFEARLHVGSSRSRDLIVLVGCVDNFSARRSIHQALANINEPCRLFAEAPDVWWIDAGNGRDSGQVLIGSETDTDHSLRPDFFASSTICRRLPAPSVVHPELLEPAELISTVNCAERIRLGEQGINVNQRCAVEIAAVMSDFLLTSSLKRYATYFDLASGTSRSEYVVLPSTC